MFSLGSSLTFLILFELAWHGHEVIAAQKSHNRAVNSVHHKSSLGVRAAKIDDKFVSPHDQNEEHLKEVRRVAQKRKDLDQAADNHKGLLILNRLVMDSFIEPTFMHQGQRTGKRRSFSEIPSAVGRVIRGLTNLTVAIGRTINSENVVNGSLARLITSRLVGVSESLMGWVERSVDDLPIPSIPRMDAQECVKRCICEAHNQPKKYGAVGLVIQLFFPPYLDTTEDTTKIVSKYQLAARYGRGENANCSAQYDGCMLNVLDVLQGAIDMIF